MADKTKIQWTEATWNPIIARRKDNDKRGWFCTKPSTGCKHCYAERMNLRLGTGLDYSVKSLNEINIEIHEETLLKPLRWTRPRMIFVSSMSDLFHESVSFEMIDRVFAVMTIANNHVFQVLTKRPARMLEYMNSRSKSANFWKSAVPVGWTLEWNGISLVKFPLPNVWLGVTCENQETADERIPLLLQTPAAVRWISAEPLLGEIDLTNIRLPHEYNISISTPGHVNCLTDQDSDHFWSDHNKIDWVVVGGESGRKDQDIRPLHPAWARSLRDQCIAAGVPFFFKQFGEYLPMGQGGLVSWSADLKLARFSDGRTGRCDAVFSDGNSYCKVGKKAAGRFLDGREWNEYPR